MSLQWKYGASCSGCRCSLAKAKRRCKGLCGTCYDRKRKEEFGDQYRMNRRVKSERQNWDSDTYMGLTPSSMDWARLAAFIDGEGHVGLTPRQAKYVPNSKSMTFCARVQVTNTNVQLPLWLVKTFGVKFKSGRQNHERWKECYWSKADGYLACWLLRNCLPWFLLKREQAEIVLEHQKTIGTFDRAPGVATPENVLQFRQGLKQKLSELNKRGPIPVAVSS